MFANNVLMATKWVQNEEVGMRGGVGRGDEETDDSSILQVQVVQLTDGIEQLQPTQSICVLSR